MAFIRCPKCNSIIDGERKACPICGCVINPDAGEEKDNFPFDEPKEEEPTHEEPVEEEPIIEDSSFEDSPIEEEEETEEEIEAETSNEYFIDKKDLKSPQEPEAPKTKPWIEQWKKRPMKYRYLWLFIFLAMLIPTIICFSVYEATKEVIVHEYPYGLGQWEEVNDNFDLFLAGLTIGMFSIFPFIGFIATFGSVVEVRNIKGYDVLVYCNGGCKLIVEGKVVDSVVTIGGRYNYHPEAKLATRLPDGTLLVVTICHFLFDYSVKFDIS